MQLNMAAALFWCLLMLLLTRVKLVEEMLIYPMFYGYRVTDDFYSLFVLCFWLPFMSLRICLSMYLISLTIIFLELYCFARACVHQCEKTGCVGGKCFQHCNFSNGNAIDGPWYLQEPLYQRWKRWDCQSDCRYQCMLSREEERKELGYKPVKYHGKWPFRRVYGIQVCS